MAPVKCPPVSLMRHRVNLQSYARTNDAGGGQTEAWSTDATVWAAIEPATGREFYQAQQTQSAVTHKITIRHRTGVTPSMRVTYGSRTFAIEAVLNPQERNVILELMCRELDPTEGGAS